jgi:hypothetical protein
MHYLRIDFEVVIYFGFCLFQYGTRAAIAVSHMFACNDSLEPTDLGNVNSYYGPGTFCAWLITITYVLYAHEWRTFSGRLRNVLPQPHAQAASITLDPSTCIAILYPLISNIYAMSLGFTRTDSMDEAELRKIQAKMTAAITVTQVSQCLALPSLFWRYIEELAMINGSSKKPHISSKGRVLMWNLLWSSGCFVVWFSTLITGAPGRISVRISLVIAVVNLVCAATLYAVKMFECAGFDSCSRGDVFQSLGVVTLFFCAISSLRVEEVGMCLPNDLRFSVVPMSAIKVTELDQMASLVSAVLAVLYSAWRDHFKRDRERTTHQPFGLEGPQADTETSS